jgi:Alkylmercury lyase
VDDADLRLRNLTYGLFVELGRAPTSDEIARDSQRSVESVRSGWRRLHEQHALVLDGAGEILMANPFSAVPTSFRVEAAGRSWYANCGWDAFGIGAALGADSTIRSTCPDCGDAIVINVADAHPDNDTMRFHVLVPAGQWWDDIGYT